MVVKSGEVEADSICVFLVSYVEEMGIEMLCDTVPSLPYILFVAGSASDTIDQVWLELLHEMYLQGRDLAMVQQVN